MEIVPFSSTTDPCNVTLKPGLIRIYLVLIQDLEVSVLSLASRLVPVHLPVWNASTSITVRINWVFSDRKRKRPSSEKHLHITEAFRNLFQIPCSSACFQRLKRSHQPQKATDTNRHVIPSLGMMHLWLIHVLCVSIVYSSHNWVVFNCAGIA